MAGAAAKQAPSSAFRRQYAVVKAQLDHTNRWIINPRHSPSHQRELGVPFVGRKGAPALTHADGQLMAEAGFEVDGPRAGATTTQ